MEDLGDISRIAVLRAMGIGDLVVSQPALAALRKRFPAAEIVLLGLPWSADFSADGHLPVDRVEVVPSLPGIGEPNDAVAAPEVRARFTHRMRALRFDLAIQMHGGGRYSNELLHELGAGTTLGLRTPDARKPDRWLPYDFFQHEVLRYLELVGLVGATTSGLAPWIPVADRDLDEADRVLHRITGPFACLSPSAGTPRRRWAPENFARIADLLHDLGLTVIVIGSEDDAPVVEAVATAATRPVVTLTGALSLCGLLGLFARARLVLANDSGPMHLAMAVGAPTAGLFWASAYSTFGPVGRTRCKALVSWRQDCPVCGAVPAPAPHYYNGWTAGCHHQVSWVDDIGVDRVADAIGDLLDETGPVAGRRSRHG